MIVVDVILHPSQGGLPQCVAQVTICNDGTAGDGSGDSPFGNYDVRAEWTPRGGKPQVAYARIEGFERRKSALALLQHAIEALAEDLTKR